MKESEPRLFTSPVIKIYSTIKGYPKINNNTHKWEENQRSFSIELLNPSLNSWLERRTEEDKKKKTNRIYASCSERSYSMYTYIIK